MGYLVTIFYAIVQSITEFLPISSSGHLVIFHQFIPLTLVDHLTFDVILHAGTLLSLIIYFWRDIVRLFLGFWQSLRNWNFRYDHQQRLPWLIILGNLPAIIVGFFLDNFWENAFRSVYWVILMLIIGAILFIVFEKISKRNRELNTMNIKDALLIGVAQILAFIPGTSRSGITIVAGLGSNFKREEAAKFSFLLAIPVIFGATIKKIIQLSSTSLSIDSLLIFILGAVVSAVVGYLVIKFLLRFLQRHSLTTFAIYRFILAIILILIFI
ncbi:undecaprenyl-diphosphatase UppP [Patescibacteria group bacterium]|nr:undecaprenyl-diphosphatase UppP [Patescibacteria group bacterium]